MNENEGIKSGIALEAFIEGFIEVAKYLENPTRITLNSWDDENFWDWEEPTKKIPAPEAKPTNKNGCCYHFWIEYTGLQEKFYHCSYCGVKKVD